MLDPVGRWPESLRALRPGGRLVVLGASAGEQVPLDVRRFYFGQYDLLGTTMGSLRDFRGLLALMDRHDVAPPVIDRTFPLARAAEAHAYLEGGGGSGRSS
nr:zinc-binding dehydrogenase [Streptomyces fuscichromogenes]